MKKTLKLAGLAALALTFAGCGKNGDAVVPEKTIVAAYVDLEKAYDDGKDLAKEVLDSLPPEMRNEAKDGYEKTFKTIDDVKNQLNPEWAVVAFGGTFKDLSKGPAKCMAIAVKVDADEDAVMKVLRKIASAPGEKAITIKRKNGNVIYIDAKDNDRIGLVDGKYLIGGASREAFEEMFNLYAGQSRASKEFDDLSRISGDTVCRIQTAPVSSLLKRFEVTKYVERFGETSQDKEMSDMVLNMGTISLDMGIADGGEVVLRVECDSSDHAEMVGKVLHLWAFANRLSVDAVRFAVKKRMIPGTVNFAQSDLFKKFLRFSEVSCSGKTAEIRSGLISSPFILAGALFPAVSSAILSANMSTMSMQGRKLHAGILLTNIERESAGKRTTVWPRTVVGKGADVGKNADIGQRAFRSATDYFNALFDIAHYGSAEWNPYVDGELLSSLWGCGVPGMTGRRLENRNVAWIVAANVTDEMPDDIPILLSANFNPALLLRKWDGRTDGSKRLPIGAASGASNVPFSDKGIVVVRKSGAVEAIKARFLTYNTLYKGRAFDLTHSNPPLVYLTPTGVVNPMGHK